MPFSHTRQGVLALATALTVLLSTLLLQEPTTMQGGLGWDGAAYHEIARRMAHGLPWTGGAPFVYRIGVPYIASVLFPDDLKRGFLAVSLPSIVLLALVVHALVARYSETLWARWLCLVLFLGAYHGLARFIPFRPYMVDAPGTFLMTLALYYADVYRTGRRPIHLTLASLVCFVGALFRESVVLGAFAMLFVDNPLTRDRAARSVALRRLPILGMPLLCWALGTILVHRAVHVDSPDTALGTLVTNTLAKKPHTVLLAFWLCFGPALLAPLLNPKGAWHFLLKHQHLLVFLAGSIALAIPGGSDTERLLYWGAPVMLVILAQHLDSAPFRAQLVWLVPLLVVQAFTHRWFALYPQSGPPSADVSFFLLPGQESRYEDLWSSHASREMRLMLFARASLVAVLLAFWVRRVAPWASTAASTSAESEPPVAKAG